MTVEPDTVQQFRLTWLYLKEVAKYTAFVVFAVVLVSGLLYGVAPWHVWRRRQKKETRHHEG